MSTDTKGLVVTDNKDVFAVCAKIEKALQELFRPYRKPFVDRETSFSPTFEVTPNLGMVRAMFKYRGEQRILHIHFGCDYDARDHGEHAILLSLGCWGSSETIMRTVLTALADLGPTYIDVNDCDDEDYVRIDKSIAA